VVWHDNLKHQTKINTMENPENSETLLEGSSDKEKGAYIGAIASLATADRQATPEEIEFLTALCQASELSEEQTQVVMNAANNISAEDVTRCLDVLKNSDLKYSLVADLIAFSKSDNNYSEQEQQHVQSMAKYLGVDQTQFSLLDNFTEKAATAQSPEEVTNPNFLSSTGLKDKMASAGINGNGLLKGLLGIVGPMILAKMVTGGLGRNRGGGMFGGGSGGGMFGGSGGGMFGGGGGGMFGGGGGGMLGGGGLGSLIGMLSGGRGMGSMGGLLGGLLGGRRGF
jgi:uncharacterized tellurite resistance protein B-like protein